MTKHGKITNTTKRAEKAREILDRHTVGEVMSLEDDIAQALRDAEREVLEKIECHAKTAKDIMDNACLPPALASVDAALRVSIEQALCNKRREALEEAAQLLEDKGMYWREKSCRGDAVEMRFLAYQVEKAAEAIRALIPKEDSE